MSIFRFTYSYIVYNILNKFIHVNISFMLAEALSEALSEGNRLYANNSSANFAAAVRSYTKGIARR